MSKENFIDSRDAVINYLIAVKKRFKQELGSDLSGLFVFGSLINAGGRGYSPLLSDVDLMVTTPLTDPSRRVHFLMKLKRLVLENEKHLRIYLRDHEKNKRDFFPVISICVATGFELNDGIHKNRNSSDAFANKSFHPLEKNDFSFVPIGRRLKPDLVGIYFPAWAILTEAQEIRSAFVSPKSTVQEEKEEEKAFDHPYYVVPKELLRSAYHLECLRKSEDSKFVVEDDIAKGLDVIKALLKNAAASDSHSVELSQLIETNRPGGKGVRLPISSQQVLYLWELLSVETEKALERRRAGSNMEALKFAADPIILELSRVRRTTLQAVDMAISLYSAKDFVNDGMLPVQVLDHMDIDQYSFSNLEKNKLKSIITEWPRDIKSYLNKQIRNEKDCGECQCKVGFAGLLSSQKAIGRHHKLIVRPLSYWILQHFNQSMLATPNDPDLYKFREKYGRELFTFVQDVKCRFPSGLFVEVAVVTKEGLITKLPKSPKRSSQAVGHGSSVLTCGIEFGLLWKSYVVGTGNNTCLNLKQALLDGLKKEFFVDSSEVADWDISTLAIHHAHLNAALLGVVRLNITKGTLYDRFPHDDEEDFENKGLQFISRDQARQYIQSDKNTGNWHQTALMRLSLVKDVGAPTSL